MDRGADGKVQSDPGTGVGGADTVFGPDRVREEFEGVGD